MTGSGTSELGENRIIEPRSNESEKADDKGRFRPCRGLSDRREPAGERGDARYTRQVIIRSGEPTRLHLRARHTEWTPNQAEQKHNTYTAKQATHDAIRNPSHEHTLYYRCLACFLCTKETYNRQFVYVSRYIRYKPSESPFHLSTRAPPDPAVGCTSTREEIRPSLGHGAASAAISLQFVFIYSCEQ